MPPVHNKPTKAKSRLQHTFTPQQRQHIVRPKPHPHSHIRHLSTLSPPTHPFNSSTPPHDPVNPTTAAHSVFVHLPPLLSHASLSAQTPTSFLEHTIVGVSFPPHARKVVDVLEAIIKEKCPPDTVIRIAGGWIRDLLRTQREYYTDHTQAIANNIFNNTARTKRRVDIPQFTPESQNSLDATQLERYTAFNPQTPKIIHILYDNIFYPRNRTRLEASNRANFNPETESDNNDIIFSPTYLERAGVLGDIDIAVNNMTGSQLGIYMESYCKEHNIPCRLQAVTSDILVSRHLATARGTIFDDVSIDLVNLRTETYATDSQHRVPTMAFGSPQEDACRRDFTVNSLYYNINSGHIEDWNGGAGLQDLKVGRLRTPLDPDSIFLDDPLRILRVVRFATRLGFIPSFDLFQAAHHKDSMQGLLHKVSRERIGKEIAGAFSHNGLSATNTGSLIFFSQLLASLHALPSVFPLFFVENARKDAIKRQYGTTQRSLRKEQGNLKKIVDIIAREVGEGPSKHGDPNTKSKWTPTMTEVVLQLCQSYEYSILALQHMMTSSQNTVASSNIHIKLLKEVQTMTNSDYNASKKPISVADDDYPVDLERALSRKIAAVQLQAASIAEQIARIEEEIEEANKTNTKRPLEKPNVKYIKQQRKVLVKLQNKIEMLLTQQDAIKSTNLNYQKTFLQMMTLLGPIQREILFYLTPILSLHANQFLFPFQSIAPVITAQFNKRNKNHKLFLAQQAEKVHNVSLKLNKHNNDNNNNYNTHTSQTDTDSANHLSLALSLFNPFSYENHYTYSSALYSTAHLRESSYYQQERFHRPHPLVKNSKDMTTTDPFAAPTVGGGVNVYETGFHTINTPAFHDEEASTSTPASIRYSHNHIGSDTDLEQGKQPTFISSTPQHLVQYEQVYWQSSTPTHRYSLDNSFRYYALLSASLLPRFYSHQLPQNNQKNRSINLKKPYSNLSKLIRYHQKYNIAPYRPYRVPFLWIDSRHDLSKNFFKQGAHLDVSYQLSSYIQDYQRQFNEFITQDNIVSQLNNSQTKKSKRTRSTPVITDTASEDDCSPSGEYLDDADYDVEPVYVYFKSNAHVFPHTPHTPITADNIEDVQHSPTHSDSSSHPNDIAEQLFFSSTSNTSLHDNLYLTNEIETGFTNEQYNTLALTSRFRIWWKTSKLTPPTINWGNKLAFPLSVENIKTQYNITHDKDHMIDQTIKNEIINEQHQNQYYKNLQNIMNGVDISSLDLAASQGINDSTGTANHHHHHHQQQRQQQQPLKVKMCTCNLCSVAYNIWHNLADGNEQYINQPPIKYLFDYSTHFKPTSPNSTSIIRYSDISDDTQVEYENRAQNDSSDHTVTIANNAKLNDEKKQCIVMNDVLKNVDITVLDKFGNVIYDTQLLENRCIVNPLASVSTNGKFTKKYKIMNNMANQSNNEDVEHNDTTDTMPLDLTDIVKFAGHYIYHSHRFHHTKLNDARLAVHYLNRGFLRDNQLKDAPEDTLNDLDKNETTKVPRKKHVKYTGKGKNKDDEDNPHKIPQIPHSNQAWSLPRLGIRMDYELKFLPRHKSPHYSIDRLQFEISQTKSLQESGGEFHDSNLEYAKTATEMVLDDLSIDANTPFKALSPPCPTDTEVLLSTKLVNFHNINNAINNANDNHHNSQISRVVESVSATPQKQLGSLYDTYNLFWVAQHHPHALPRLLSSVFPQILSHSTFNSPCTMQDDLRGLFYDGLRLEKSKFDDILSNIRIASSFATMCLDSYYIKHIYNTSFNRKQKHFNDDSEIISLPFRFHKKHNIGDNDDNTGEDEMPKFNPDNAFDQAISNILHIRASIFSKQTTCSPQPCPPLNQTPPLSYHEKLDHRIRDILFHSQHSFNHETQRYENKYETTLTYEQLDKALFPYLSHLNPSKTKNNHQLNLNSTVQIPISPALSALGSLLFYTSSLSTTITIANTLLSNWKTNSSQNSAEHHHMTYHNTTNLLERLTDNVTFNPEDFSTHNVTTHNATTHNATTHKNIHKKPEKYNFITDFRPKAMFQQLLHPNLYSEQSLETTLTHQSLVDYLGLQNRQENVKGTRIHKKQWDATLNPSVSVQLDPVNNISIESSSESYIFQRYTQPFLYTLTRLGLLELTQANSIDVDGQVIKEHIDNILIEDMQLLGSSLNIDTGIFNPLEKDNSRDGTDQQQQYGDGEVQRRWLQDWSCVCGGAVDIATVLSAILPELSQAQMMLVVRFILYRTQQQSLSCSIDRVVVDHAQNINSSAFT